MGVSLYGNAIGGFSPGLLIAASGLNDAQVRMDVSANNIANENTDSFIPSRDVSHAIPGGGVASYVQPAVNSDEPEETISLLLAKTQFEANARMVKAYRQTDHALIDMAG